MDLTGEIERAKESLLKTFELAQLYGADDVKNPDSYLKMAEELISIKDTDKKCNEALEEAKKADTLNDFEETLAIELEKRKKKPNVKNTAEYKSFAKPLLNKMLSLEEDQFILGVEVNANDPITRKRMQNPVVNIHCGHHYEQNVILEMIKVNSSYGCPVACCGNKKFITKEDLEIDDEFRQQILATTDEEENDD